MRTAAIDNATLLLSASQIAELLDHKALLHGLREAMRAYANSDVPRGQRAHSPVNDNVAQSVMIVFPGLIPGIPAYTVKVNAKLPWATPSVLGLVNLHDSATGRPLAIMDSGIITEVRTALVGGIAADALARRSIDTVAIIGAGVQGRAQLRTLRMVREFSAVRVFDLHAERAARLIEDVSPVIDATFSIVDSPEAAVRDADVIITATWAKAPFLTRDMIKAGAHITAVGADEPGKAELSADLILGSRFVCDDPDLALSMGALAGVSLGRDAIHASLGHVLGDASLGRQSDDDITIFGSVGLPCQDLAAVWQVYQAALEHGAGTHFTFPATE
ncbi:MAG: ornithine cyclodeaminase family protein [Gemmatimonadota bacterium]